MESKEDLNNYIQRVREYLDDIMEVIDERLENMLEDYEFNQDKESLKAELSDIYFNEFPVGTSLLSFKDIKVAMLDKTRIRFEDMFYIIKELAEAERADGRTIRDLISFRKFYLQLPSQYKNIFEKDFINKLDELINEIDHTVMNIDESFKDKKMIKNNKSYNLQKGLQ